MENLFLKMERDMIFQHYPKDELSKACNAVKLWIAGVPVIEVAF